MRRPALLFGCLAACFATGCLAQSFDVKTGLWEQTENVEMPGMPMPDLSQVPPEHRAQMEQMLKQQGIGGTRTTVRKSCMTAEKLNRGSEWMRQNDPDCRYEIKTRTRERFAGTMTCDKGTATVDFRATDREHVTGTLEGQFGEGGRMQAMHMEFSSRWLGPDCGSVK